MRRTGLLVSAALFVLLTAAGTWWATANGGVTLADATRLLGLGGRHVIAIAGLVFAVHLFDFLRYLVFGWALGVRVSVRAGVDAVIGNDFFSWLTPGASLGMPAAIYLLSRRGVPTDAAVLICFFKSATGVAFLIAMGFTTLALGLGPPSLSGTVGGLLVWGAGLTALFLTTLMAAAFFPAQARRLTNRLRGTTRDSRISQMRHGAMDTAEAGLTRLVAFRERGPATYVALVLSHAPYFAAFAAVPAYFAFALGAAPDGPTAGAGIMYLSLLYLAPTPGAAGLSEATAEPFFAHLVTPAAAVAVVLGTRLVTLYLQLLVGFAYLTLTVGLKTALTAAMRAASPNGPKPE